MEQLESTVFLQCVVQALKREKTKINIEQDTYKVQIPYNTLLAKPTLIVRIITAHKQ